MLIALDYDRTFTTDPDGWRAVVALMRARGHEFICVTGRKTPPSALHEPAIPMRIICAGDDFKSRAALRTGLHVDVWIDDMPGTIEEARILSWDNTPLSGA